MKWIKTAHKGLRYYEHTSRKHGKKKDRYYSIRFKVDGKDFTYGIGWWSDGVPQEVLRNDPNMGFEEYCLTQLRLFKTNMKNGIGVTSPKEKRRIAKEKELHEQAEQERLEREAVTIKTFFEDTYLPLSKADKKEKTVEREESLFKTWISPALGHLPMKDISPFQLEQLKRDMVVGKQSPRSIEYALSVIRQIFNTARHLAAFSGDNPTANVKFPKPDNGRMRFLTRTEADKLLAALKKKSDDVYEMTLLSLHSGLRFGEIRSLTWQDVDTETGILIIRDAKAGSRYAFPTEQALEMLKARKQRLDDTKKGKGLEPCKPSDFVFEGRNGQLNILSYTFRRTVDELELNNGIEDPRLKICFHSCRHTYASWMVEQGQDLYTVQKLLGHKTNVMTQRYAHLSENKLKDAAMSLGQSLTPNVNNAIQEQAAQVGGTSSNK